MRIEREEMLLLTRCYVAAAVHLHIWLTDIELLPINQLLFQLECQTDRVPNIHLSDGQHP